MDRRGGRRRCVPRDAGRNKISAKHRRGSEEGVRPGEMRPPTAAVSSSDNQFNRGGGCVLAPRSRRRRRYRVRTYARVTQRRRPCVGAPDGVASPSRPACTHLTRRRGHLFRSAAAALTTWSRDQAANGRRCWLRARGPPGSWLLLRA